MKKTLLYPVLFALLAAPTMNAQFLKNNTQQESVPNWYNQSPEDDNVYGAAVDKANELLKGKKAKKQVTVALIGTGVDIEHPALKQAIWKNPKEKPNGKDDDKNGYVDDLHGWNFLGNAKGENVERISRTADREYICLRDKYYGYYDQNGKYYRVSQPSGKLEEVPAPENLEEYNYFRYKVLGESQLGRVDMGITMVQIMQSYMPEFDALVKKAYPDGLVSPDQFMQVVHSSVSEEDLIGQTVIALTGYVFMSKGNDWNAVRDFVMTDHLENAKRSAQEAFATTLLNDRDLIGDNPYDINDPIYGNNVLSSANSGPGTMQAGILAGSRTVGEVPGVNDQVKLMTLRMDANYEGEPYMKDMALAIRYAVDKGADIIQLDKTNTIYPMPQAAWVNEALLYAQSKGVLIVLPVMDLSYNLDQMPFYPFRELPGGITLDNVITVAASDANGNPLVSANFSQTGLDLFAPGMNIQSTYMGDTYRMSSGSFLAASVVSGVASLLKSYYPNLTPAQIRTLLIENVTDRSDAEVEKEYIMFDEEGNPGRAAKDLFLFEELCVSGGIVNAYKALQAAASFK